MKKPLSLLILLCLLLAPGLSAVAEAGGTHTIEAKALTFYYGNPDTSMPANVYFIDGADVPYLALSDWPAIVRGPGDAAKAAGEDNPTPVPLTFSMAGSVGTLTRPDGYSADFDCDADTIHFLDYDAFLRNNSEAYFMDMLDELNTVDENGAVHYFLRSPSAYQRYGQEVTLNAGDYGIDFIAQGGECYVPMQTLSDILLSISYNNIYYNGEAAIIATLDAFGESDALTPLGELLYSVPPHARSAAMAQFSYNELCLALDTLYGLKGNHGITTFRDLIEDTGLDDDLAGTDPVAADAALYQLLNLHLDDLHTRAILPSPASGIDAAEDFGDAYGKGQSRMNRNRLFFVYSDARDAAMPGGAPAYEEIGSTAWITFDEFDALPTGVDYYTTPLHVESEADLNGLNTLGLMIYAYSRITRADSPIENVVLDMSCNRGGDSQAAVYTIAAFLGVCSISARNTCSGALVTGNYLIDLNLDGATDEADRLLTQKNLFCLESPLSFSCGNLVPCALKASNAVTLLGRTSGGGTCVVLPLSTADGASFCISGPIQLSFLKNGGFYDIDRGAAPDFPLTNPASFYDREALTEFVEGVR